MTSRRTHAAWLAGLSGAASPLVLIAAWAAVAALWRSPASRLAAFLDPGSVHRVHASGVILESGIGILMGLAISLLLARAARGERWLPCIFFLAAFATACVIPAALHEGWLRAPSVLAHPLLVGFVVAVIAGFAFAPRMTGPLKPMSHPRG
jgi:hypothetical protein